MRKALSIICCFIGIVITFTCDDEPLEGNFILGDSNTTIFGEWQLVRFTVDASSVIDDNTTEITTDVSIQSTENVNYSVTFTENGTFTTAGSYEYTAEVELTGFPPQSSSLSIEGIDGSGTYTLDEANIITEDSFFEFDESASVETIGAQTLAYQLSNNGETLTLSQNETVTDTSTGIEVSVTQASTSTWTRAVNNDD